MAAIIFALIAYFGWAVGAFFETIAARKINSYSLTFWGLLIGAAISSFYLPFAISSISGFTLGLLLLNLLLALFFIGGIFVYYEALKIENRSLTGTIAQAFPVFTVTLSILFLGEKLNSIQSLAIIITFIGLVLCIFDFRDVSQGKKLLNRGTALAFAVSISWGIYFAFIKLLVDKVGVVFAELYRIFAFSIGIFGYESEKDKT